MKMIWLTQGQFTLVDDEDYGWLNQFSWFVKKHKNIYYAERNSLTKNGKRKTIKMHREILGLLDSKIFGDHEDHNGLNNQKYNLRKSTNAENCANRNSHKNSSSKYLGVSWINRDRKWKAAICKNSHTKFLGYFSNQIDAALAYNKAAIELHGEFANLNNIETATHLHSAAG